MIDTGQTTGGQAQMGGSMGTWADVERIVASLPAVDQSTSFGNRAWKINKLTFAWARPLGKGDRSKLGDAAPAGEILAVRVEDQGAKQAVLGDTSLPCFRRGEDATSAWQRL